MPPPDSIKHISVLCSSIQGYPQPAPYPGNPPPVQQVQCVCVICKYSIILSLVLGMDKGKGFQCQSAYVHLSTVKQQAVRVVYMETQMRGGRIRSTDCIRQAKKHCGWAVYPQFLTNNRSLYDSSSNCLTLNLAQVSKWPSIFTVYI